MNQCVLSQHFSLDNVTTCVVFIILHVCIYCSCRVISAGPHFFVISVTAKLNFIQAVSLIETALIIVTVFQTNKVCAFLVSCICPIKHLICF